MKDFCNSFVLSYEGKSVETLWLELQEALNAGIGKFIATNQRVVAAQRQQRGLVAVTIRGSVLFYSSAI